jgi:hypothetical protein
VKVPGLVVIIAILVGLAATGHLYMLATWLGAPFSTEEIVLYRGAYTGPAISLYIADFIIIGVAVVVISIAIRRLVASRQK